MRLSEDRISNISHKIHDRLYLDEFVDFKDEDGALKEIKQVFTQFIEIEDRLDDEVRNKIRTLKRGVVQGTPEWDILYSKYFEEEMLKKGYK